MAEPADAPLIEVLRARTGRATQVRLRDGRVLDVFNVAWGYDEAGEWSHVTTNVSPTMDGHAIDVFSTAEVAEVTDPSGEVLFVFGPRMEDQDLNLAQIREMIRHEDMLRDQRLGWLFALDGFLFTALAIGWGKEHSGAILWVLAGFGVATGLSAAGSMELSDLAIRNLRDLANCRGRVMGIQKGCFKDQEKIEGIAQLYPWKIMPWALAGVWVGLLIVHGIAFSWW
jgi:hypothetical protein